MHCIQCTGMLGALDFMIYCRARVHGSDILTKSFIVLSVSNLSCQSHSAGLLWNKTNMYGHFLKRFIFLPKKSSWNSFLMCCSLPFYFCTLYYWNRRFEFSRSVMTARKSRHNTQSGHQSQRAGAHAPWLTRAVSVLRKKFLWPACLSLFSLVGPGKT